jgi:plasmid stabilization system protein ParE
VKAAISPPAGGLSALCVNIAASSQHWSYVIFFRYVDDTFEVVNIIEGNRDIEALYRDL